MKLAAVAFLVVGAWAACDTSTCYVCQQDTTCAWFTASGVSDCRVNTSSVTSVGFVATAPGQCPSCQAGSCTECTNQTGCSWFKHSTGLSSKCANTSSPPTSTTGTYTALASCPPCKDINDCTLCNNNNNCTWYVLPGATGGKCGEITASPGFAYSRVTTSFCSGGNPCAGVATCMKCRDANGTLANNTPGHPCQWLTPKSGLAALYNAKCDYDFGTFDSGFYDVAATCPPCTGSNCKACKEETNCKWSAVSVAGVTSFGQCLQTSTPTPGGKTDIAVCPATCEIFSCSQCVANSDCRWFTGSSAGLSDTCDRASDIGQHPLTVTVSSVQGCPPCKASRCFECNNEANCGWYVNTILGGDVPGTGECAPTAASHSNERRVENTDKKCDGASDGFAVSPSLLAAVVTFLVYHN